MVSALDDAVVTDWADLAVLDPGSRASDTLLSEVAKTTQNHHRQSRDSRNGGRLGMSEITFSGVNSNLCHHHGLLDKSGIVCRASPYTSW